MPSQGPFLTAGTPWPLLPLPKAVWLLMGWGSGEARAGSPEPRLTAPASVPGPQVPNLPGRRPGHFSAEPAAALASSSVVPSALSPAEAKWSPNLCHMSWPQRNKQPRRGPSPEGSVNGPCAFYCQSDSSNNEILTAKQKSWFLYYSPDHGQDRTAGGGQGSFWGPWLWSCPPNNSLELGWGLKEHTFLQIFQVGLPPGCWGRGRKDPFLGAQGAFGLEGGRQAS